MCFSNLPVEFDEDGNPFLADEADGVRRVEGASGDDVTVDPAGAYTAIVEEVPERVRRDLAWPDADEGREAAEGD